jgi:hypothetical protein
VRPVLRLAATAIVGAVGIAAGLVALRTAPAPDTTTRSAPAVARSATPGPATPSRNPAPTSTVRADPPPAGSSFTPGRYDVDAHIKQAAAQFVERVGSWRTADPDQSADRLTAAGYPPDLVAMAAPLLDIPAREATTTVIYPQYGGLTEASASVMVLARQQLRTDDGDRVREVLLDMRMAKAADGTWQVTSTVDPARPQIAPRRPGGPTQAGRAVLDDPAIRIPEPGRADIADRRVNDPILAVLARLADTYALDVQVLVSGHPGTVFPTSRVSNHTAGRAVDIRAVNGRPVSSIPRDDPLLADFMVAAGRAGATEVGGPIAPSGRGFFSDAVHQDHFHLGITPTKPPAAPRDR